MEKKSLGDTFNFARSGRESILYLKLLGAKEIEINNDKYYLLDNMLFHQKWKDNFLLVKGIDENLFIELKRSPLETYFREGAILNLEGLVYLHSIINHGNVNLDKYYNDTLDNLKYKALSEVHKEFNKIDISPFVSDLKVDLDLELKNNFLLYKYFLDQLNLPNYIFSDPKILDKFLQNHAIFHTDGVYPKEYGSPEEKCGFFEYKYDKNVGSVEIYPGFIETKLEILDKDNYAGSKKVIHNYNTRNGESLKYIPMDFGDDTHYLELNITTNTFEDTTGRSPIKREATNDDYEYFTNVMREIYTSVMNKFGLYNNVEKHQDDRGGYGF